MRIVHKAEFRPHHCAVFPHLGSAQVEGYFDPGVDLPGPGVYRHHTYVSVVAVKELARQLGWVSPQEKQELLDQIEGLRHDVVELEKRADAAEAVVDSIDVIESAAFRARKRAGRKKEAVTHG